MTNIRTIHTLGPAGTNCEEAAKTYCRENKLDAEVILHKTLEDALEALKLNPQAAALLGCIVYPRLHEIVFGNLSWLELSDLFIMPTFNMVLATRDPENPQETAATHPAPRQLLDQYPYNITEVNSNSEAAKFCGDGKFDACITTKPACEANSLTIIEDFGPVPMGFSIHTPK